MLDKNRLVDYLKKEIESCKVVGTHDDKAIIYELEKIIKRIEIGFFDNH